MSAFFVEDLSALILVALIIIGVPYAILSLFLSSLKQQPSIPDKEHFSETPRIAQTCALVMMSICLFDIFILYTIVITFVAAFFSAITTSVVVWYISYVCKHRYGLVARINNG